MDRWRTASAYYHFSPSWWKWAAPLFLCVSLLAGMCSPFLGHRRSRITSSITVAIIIWAGWMAFWAIEMAYARQNGLGGRQPCPSNLRQIGQACLMYAVDNGGHNAPDLAALLMSEDITQEVFVCPWSADTATDVVDPQQAARLIRQRGFCSYEYLGAHLDSTSPPDAVLVYEHLEDHGTEGMNVLFNDGHVEWIDIVGARLILRQVRAGVAIVRWPQK